MVAIITGRSLDKTRQLVFLSTPSTTDASLVGEMFAAPRRRISAAVGVPRAVLGREQNLGAVFPAVAVPSFHILGGRMELGDIAAMDAVEGRAWFGRAQRARGV